MELSLSLVTIDSSEVDELLVSTVASENSLAEVEPPDVELPSLFAVAVWVSAWSSAVLVGFAIAVMARHDDIAMAARMTLAW